MARAGKYTSIPKKGKSDPQIDAIAANLELITGQKGGQSGKRAVLVEDLDRLGIVSFSGGKLRLGDNVGGGVTPGTGTPPTPPGTVEPPTTPTGVTGSSGFLYISMTWDAPTYLGHSYAEVYLSEVDDFGTAVRVAVTPANIVGYSVELGWEGYGWVRFVNELGAVGPIQHANGVHFQTQADIGDLIDQLVGQIGEIHLTPVLDGQLEKLHEYQDWIEERQAEGMIEEAIAQDVRAVELREGELTLRATLATEYYTGVDTDAAIARATLEMKAEIEDPDGTSLGATLKNSYYTSATTDSVVAAATTALKADIEDPKGSSVGADLENNYSTTVEVGQAIAAADLALKTAIEDPNGTSLGATLRNNYYTKVDTDAAISSAITTVKAEIEDPNGTSLGAQVDTVSQALAETDGYQQALWGVKVKAGDVTASIGLVAKSDPNNPDIDNAFFVVKDADFRVLYSKNPGDPDDEQVSPIFGTIDNPNYDSSDPDSPKKILVIDTATIKVANINDLTVGEIVADRIVSNSTITSPKIVGGNIAIGGNFAVTSAGNMTFNNFTGKNGSLTGRMNIGGGYLYGDNTPATNRFISTTNNLFYVRHDGYLYAQNGRFEGTVRADRIDSDVVAAAVKSVSGFKWYTNGHGTNTRTIYSGSIGSSASSSTRVFIVPPINVYGLRFGANYAYTSKLYMQVRLGSTWHTCPSIDHKSTSGGGGLHSLNLGGVSVPGIALNVGSGSYSYQVRLVSNRTGTTSAYNYVQVFTNTQILTPRLMRKGTSIS